MDNITVEFDLSNWTKSKEIVPILIDNFGFKNKVSADSAWRATVRYNNALYVEGKAEHYIVHGQKGFKWAENLDEIASSIRDLEKRAISMLVAVNKTRKALEVTGQGELTNNLASLRKEAGISGKSMVDMVKKSHPNIRMDQPTLSRIETGASMPTSEQMIALSEALGKKTYEVFGAQALLV